MNNLLTDSFEIPRGQTSRDGDIELGLQVPSSSELGLGGFNKQVEDIGKQIDKLSKLLNKLQDANEESKAVTKAVAMKAIKQSMGKDIDKVMKIASTAKSKLEELNKDNLTNRQKPGCGEGSSVDRMRITNTLSLQKKLKEKLSEFQVLREKIQQEYREVVERRVFTVTGNNADEETIDRLIETGNSEQIFQRAIQEQGRGQIFRDIAVLVDTQQDMLDNIQTNVDNARGYVDKGIQALTRARKLQKNSRKCMCWSIIFLLVVALIIVLSFHPWTN